MERFGGTNSNESPQTSGVLSREENLTETPPPTLSEIKVAIRIARIEKQYGPGSDGIHAEIIKYWKNMVRFGNA